MIKNITKLTEWQALKAHKLALTDQRMQDWFSEDPIRYKRFSLKAGGILLDYSKNIITNETLALLTQLAKDVCLADKIKALFSGSHVNVTENKPALHTALRTKSTQSISVNGTNIVPLILESLTKVEKFVKEVHTGSWRGYTDKPISDIVNIGIGGSHLGPLLATNALTNYSSSRIRSHFISNIDAAHLEEVLNAINPESTLFIISSKSFTTLETITNAETIKNWLLNKIVSHQKPASAISRHFVAITAATEKAVAFGVPADQVFPLWDWVGGRYSVWSSIGLPLALVIGMENFSAFLEGANEMDQHFSQADFSQNMPVIMALLGIWYINFFSAQTHAIVPYSHHLTHLYAYLQQADMESNGKNISLHGKNIEYATGPIIWGAQGCNAQHAFHQLLHQGNHFTPVDFILVGKSLHAFNKEHDDILIASGLSQAQALMQGKTLMQAFYELIEEGFDEETAKELAPHKTIIGNKPSNILFLDEVSPRTLGNLLALYEHKIYVQGVLWNINSYDQWGVELGKQLLPKILSELQQSTINSIQDSSTSGLIQHYKNLRKIT